MTSSSFNGWTMGAAERSWCALSARRNGGRWYICLILPENGRKGFRLFSLLTLNALHPSFPSPVTRHHTRFDKFHTPSITSFAEMQFKALTISLAALLSSSVAMPLGSAEVAISTSLHLVPPGLHLLLVLHPRPPLRADHPRRPPILAATSILRTPGQLRRGNSAVRSFGGLSVCRWTRCGASCRGWLLGLLAVAVLRKQIGHDGEMRDERWEQTKSKGFDMM